MVLDVDVTRISLLSRVRDVSDDAAWAEFESRYRELVMRYALALGVQYADADDIGQVVMMSLAKSLRTFQYTCEKGRFRNYLGRVVRNAVFRFRQRPNSFVFSLENNVEPADAAAEGDAVDALWEQEWVDHHYRLALRTVRQTFDPLSVEMFERLVEGQSVREIAELYGTTEQAVHKIKQRIRARMKELIEAQVREEDEPEEPRRK